MVNRFPTRGSKGLARPIRIGFIGAGRATCELHLAALRHVADAEVVAIADPDPQALGLALARCQSARGEADYRTLLSSPEVDAVAICVPVGLHTQMALEAMEVGKHLFIEKPLALTLQQCDRMLERTADLPLTIQVGFNTRWHRFTRKAKEQIEQGKIGTLNMMRGVLVSMHKEMPEWRRRRATGGGAILETAIHHFDLWRFLTGLEVEEVTAQTHSGQWDDESATITARLNQGVLATGAFGVRTSQNNAIEIYGNDGSLNLAFYRFDGLETFTPSDIPGSVSGRKRRLMQFLGELPKGIATMRQGGEWHLSYVEQWKHFVAAIQQGQPSACGLEEGRQALAIALAALQASETGATVKVPRS